ncbi:hypothetical protein [Actinoplanes sp. NPDC049316]|uniref:hypothetical protein n=1 Tax=Actinoplanes sp. NPDC049316 TaxID=3154727 RepID=UPI0034238531
MSEQGWRQFLAAEGLQDWVVLHGGATAVFRVPSLGEATRLAAVIAQVPGLAGALLTAADDRLTVRLTRGVPARGAARRARTGDLGARPATRCRG